MKETQTKFVHSVKSLNSRVSECKCPAHLEIPLHQRAGKQSVLATVHFHVFFYDLWEKYGWDRKSHDLPKKLHLIIQSQQIYGKNEVNVKTECRLLREFSNVEERRREKQ